VGRVPTVAPIASLTTGVDEEVGIPSGRPEGVLDGEASPAAIAGDLDDARQGVGDAGRTRVPGFDGLATKAWIRHITDLNVREKRVRVAEDNRATVRSRLAESALPERVEVAWFGNIGRIGAQLLQR